MSKSIRLFLVVLAMGASGAAHADFFNLGNMGPPGLRVIGNTFDAPQTFVDQYAFSVSGAADSFGGLLTFDLSARRDIDIWSVSLWNGASLITDGTADGFAFSNLSAGSYSIFVNGAVTGREGGLLGGGLVGYAGTFVTTASASVPEPGTVGLFGIGLLGLFFARRRQQVR